MIGAAFLVAIAGLVVWVAIQAEHTSRCSVCDEAIEPGNAIVCVDDEWVHEECEP